MYKKIMVPLDGSELAECVLPHVEAMAKGNQVDKIVFVRVVEPFEMAPTGEEYVFTQEDRKRIESERKSAAEDYLRKLLEHLKYDGTRLGSEIVEGKVPESLAEYAEKNEMDLIVIATHGRSGISKWVLGSVADRILRSSCVPVLMVRAPGCVPGI
jgi:nucleotide-binding universal stress UspA family protein